MIDDSYCQSQLTFCGGKKNQYYSALKMQIALQGWAESPENSGQRLDSELKSGKMQLSKHDESN